MSIVLSDIVEMNQQNAGRQVVQEHFKQVPSSGEGSYTLIFDAVTKKSAIDGRFGLIIGNQEDPEEARGSYVTALNGQVSETTQVEQVLKEAVSKGYGVQLSVKEDGRITSAELTRPYISSYEGDTDVNV